MARLKPCAVQRGASAMMACGHDAPRDPDCILMTKQGLYHQIISFIEIAVYLLVLFGIFALHEALVAGKDGIQFHFYGFAIVNSLIFGKVILVAEDFGFAEWF